jgi:uncharacterized RDD family membrane protein YckC
MVQVSETPPPVLPPHRRRSSSAAPGVQVLTEGATGSGEVLGKVSASIWLRRVGAFLVDAAIFEGGGALLLMAGLPPTKAVTSNPDTGQITVATHFSAGFWVAACVVLLLQVAYFTVLNGSPRGQTVGKMVFHIAVRDRSTGGPIGLGRAALRALVVVALGLVFLVPLALDAFAALADPEGRSWHDLAAGSVVVEVR